MRRQLNRYRNHLGPTATSYMVLVGVIVAITGSAFVYMKNQHLAQEDRKRELEREITEFEEESEYLNLKIQIVLGKNNLYKALRERNSELREKINPAVLTMVRPAKPPMESMDPDTSLELGGGK